MFQTPTHQLAPPLACICDQQQLTAKIYSNAKYCGQTGTKWNIKFNN